VSQLAAEFLQGFAAVFAGVSRVIGVPEAVRQVLTEHDVTIADLVAAGAAATDIAEFEIALGRLPKS
jgi:hypothetical protein